MDPVARVGVIKLDPVVVPRIAQVTHLASVSDHLARHQYYSQGLPARGRMPTYEEYRAALPSDPPNEPAPEPIVTSDSEDDFENEVIQLINIHQRTQQQVNSPEASLAASQELLDAASSLPWIGPPMTATQVQRIAQIREHQRRLQQTMELRQAVIRSAEEVWDADRA